MFDAAAMFASIAKGISSQFGGPYHDARVIDQAGAVYDDGGSIVTSGTPTYRDCSVQVDSVTEAMRTDGYTEGDVRFLVLAGSLTGSLGTDALVEVLAGPHVGAWMVSAIDRDPCGAYWQGRGRRA